jgi:hypothetical protein
VKDWLRNLIRSVEPHPRASVEEVLRTKYSRFRHLLQARTAVMEALSFPLPQENRQLILDQAGEIVNDLNALSGRDHQDLLLRLEQLHEGSQGLREKGAVEKTLNLAHDLAVEEMSALLDTHGVEKIRVKKVVTGLSINLHVFDLDGGFSADSGKVMARECISSLPMQAMFKGMYYPGVTWSGPIGLNLRGLMVIMAQSSSRPEEDFWDKTLALIAPDYVSYNSRLGYHYASVDSYLSDDPYNNHVRFTFKGGAADDLRRARRARFIATVLERIGFAVRWQNDFVEARFLRQPRPDTEERLDLLGRLMGCSRQRDMVMNDDTVVEWHTEAFLRGNYLFDPDS